MEENVIEYVNANGITVEEKGNVCVFNVSGKCEMRLHLNVFPLLFSFPLNACWLQCFFLFFREGVGCVGV